MIDFRYHLVSLVAVFLALAVGIVLGAGPLAQPIGDTLTGQVDKLREDRNALSNQLTETKAKLATSDKVGEQFAGRIFNNVLSGVQVALVVLPGADGEDVKNVSAKLGQAGGAVSAQVNLRPEFFSADKKAYREALSGQITQYLDDPTRATTPETTLAAAVGQLVFVGQNEALTGILTVADTPLLQVTAPAEAPARIAVIVGPRTSKATPSQSEPTDKTKPAATPESAYLEFARTLNSFAGGAVVFGAAATITDLVSVIRVDPNPVSTVDGIGSESALLTLPFALVATINGTVGAWGSGQGASALVPPLNLTVNPAEPPAQPSQPSQPAQPAPPAPAAPGASQPPAGQAPPAA
ncbi:copper transporter [Mobiluncus porci]|uniref:Copper transporter n=1 Tax=Mobiluncus porci TaxID=2652278 RepID=A0A7K0JZZ3_9ACTO|nr:copper transporter [Mobiluncus porci]MST48724.1 copper transporter [Mobiluncus porci]